MKTNKRNSKSSRLEADRFAAYRARQADGSIPEQVQALESRWAALRARCDVVIDDVDYFQQALNLAAAPTASEEQGRAKLAILVAYGRADAAFANQRLITAMIDAAVVEERRQWPGLFARRA